MLLFTIKIERSGGEGDRSTELHQALNGVTVTDQGGGTRLVSWRDCETGEEREVTVSRRGQTEQGEVPARVVYIENAAGNTTQIVRPRATQL